MEENVIKVNIKWMGKTLEDVSMYLNEPLETFKAQLWTLTGVPPERQKIMYRGLIPNNADLSKLNLTDGSKLMLVGSAEKPPECSEKIRFFEDLTPQERAKLLRESRSVKVPCGIMNLGNTCYFNSVIQFLIPVTELWDGIVKLTKDNTSNSDTGLLVRSLLDMKNQLSVSFERYIPILQIQYLRKLNPLFCRKDEKTGAYLQQDAEECLNFLFSIFNGLADEKIVDNMFGFSLITKITPAAESKTGDSATEKLSEPEEHDSCGYEQHLLLNCYMGTQLKSISNIMDGIMLSLNEELTKFSEVAGTDILHNKTCRLNSLPQYLITHLVRFEWKQKSQVSLSDAIKAKVCRRVNFERYLDVTSLCSEDLQAKLRSANTVAIGKESASETPVSSFDGYEITNGKYATGKYELISIVTHQGRTADAGHYICWAKDMRGYRTSNTVTNVSSDAESLNTKKQKNVDVWLKFDDDVVSEHDWGTFDLCGGRSDYHIAVLLLYKAEYITI